MKGARTLSDLSSGSMLRIACKRCQRFGKLRITRLLDEHGADAALPDVAKALQAGCPRDGQYGGCFVHFPDLVT